jgi:hypothetical protein
MASDNSVTTPGLLAWLPNSVSGAPAAFQPRPDGPLAYACEAGPVGEGVHYSIYLQEVVVTPVVHLLVSCCPSNVAWFVVARVVDAVERISMAWTAADVFVEGLKRSNPRLVHGDALSSVVLELVRLRIEATHFDSTPRSVFRRLCHAMREWAVEASTGLRYSVHQASCSADELVAAFALTLPSVASDASHHSKAAKHSAGQFRSVGATARTAIASEQGRRQHVKYASALASACPATRSSPRCSGSHCNNSEPSKHGSNWNHFTALHVS